MNEENKKTPQSDKIGTFKFDGDGSLIWEDNTYDHKIFTAEQVQAIKFLIDNKSNEIENLKQQLKTTKRALESEETLSAALEYTVKTFNLTSQRYRKRITDLENH